MASKRFFQSVLVSGALVLSVGCDTSSKCKCGSSDSGTHDSGADATQSDAGGDAGAVMEAIEIEGRWHNNFGGTEVIDAESFTFAGSTATVIEFDNMANSMISQNAADAMFSPGKFNRIVWTEKKAGAFYYCTVDYDLDTADAARTTTKTADSSDPDNTGCGGFSWTKLSPVIAVEGKWTDGTTSITIDSDMWDELAVVSYDASSAITQTPAPDAGAMTFSKVVWTKQTSKRFYACVVSMNEASSDDAASNAGAATESDLAKGCLGSEWTKWDAQ